MGIDTIVNIHPKRIRKITEVDEVLSKIDQYEKQLGCRAGVVLKQNMQLGGSYRVISEEEATRGPYSTCERYVGFFPRSYFEELRKTLKGNGSYQH